MRKIIGLQKMGMLVLFVFLMWVGFGMEKIVASENDYEFQAVDGGVEITKYIGTDKEVTIPDTLNGESVVGIGSYAFSNKSLTNVKLPETLQSIENFAFLHNQLTSIVIGENITSIGGSVFANNPLEQIGVDSKNQNFKDIDGKVLYTEDGKRLIQSTISGEIAEGTERIGNGAFWGIALEDMTIPDSVTNIDNYAFQDSQLTSVIIPETIIRIGIHAFWDNPDLFIFGKVGSEAEKYANNYNDVRFINIDEPYNVVSFIPNGSTEQLEKAETKVKVYSSHEALNLQYQWSSSSETPTSGEWTEFANHSNITSPDKMSGVAYLHIRGLNGDEVVFNEVSNSFQLERRIFEVGDGTEANPYIIETAEQLNEVRNNLEAHYKLGADIDLSEHNDGQGWDRIGDSWNHFNGSFNGDGKTINNLYISSGDHYQGLFSIIGDEGVIKNVNLSNVQINSPTAHFIGGLAGKNDGKIENVSVQASKIEGRKFVGGLVGFNGGKVIKSNAAVNVFGISQPTTPSFDIGGLIGTNSNGIAEESYATGNVLGENNIGGLIGSNSGGETKINASYSTGEVSGSSDVGGLVGNNEEMTGVTNSYWDMDASGQNDSAGGEGKTSAEMKQRATFLNWDFEDVWFQYEEETTPFHRWQDPFVNWEAELLDSSLSVGKETSIQVTATHQNSSYDATATATYAVVGGTDVITIDKGRVTAEKSGDATIQVSLYGESKLLDLTVTEGSGGGGGSPSLPSKSDDTSLGRMAINFDEDSLIEFDPNESDFYVKIEANVAELVIEPSHGKARVKVNDEIVEGKVTLPLEEGENAFEIVVTAEDGTEAEYTLMVYRLQEVPFPDIEGHWAEDYIKKAYRNGWFKGYPDGNFGPENNVTRMQAASLFVRILGLTERSAVSFTDIHSVEDETVEELEKAYVGGVVNGFPDQTFRPYQAVTRVQLALMIYRSYEKVTGRVYELEQQADFPDITGYDEEAQNAIAMLVELGIAEGSEGNFLPSNHATRAHTAKMLINYHKVLTKLQ